MKLLAGTSGYAFKEWKGPFYPEKMKDTEMLAFYASRFPTVEINNTFYRLPRENVLVDWGSQVPAPFTFAIKASQRITHHARLKPESFDTVDFLLKNTVALGAHLGPILFQLPPNLKVDLDRLRAFVERLPTDRRYTIEFRHESWFDEAVFAVLRDRNIAFCISEQTDFKTPVVSTASWGYVRLHRLDYDEQMLKAWVAAVKPQPWSDAYVYLKHDEGAGSGPPAVETLARIWDS
jgi:uncharacterized protein YecE (DUF72 family)